MTTTARYPIKS